MVRTLPNQEIQWMTHAVLARIPKPEIKVLRIFVFFCVPGHANSAPFFFVVRKVPYHARGTLMFPSTLPQRNTENFCPTFEQKQNKTWFSASFVSWRPSPYLQLQRVYLTRYKFALVIKRSRSFVVKICDYLTLVGCN